MKRKAIDKKYDRIRQEMLKVDKKEEIKDK